MKILFVTATRIGDAILSTGLLSYLQDTYPDARFTIACGPAAAPLFRAVPRLDRIIVLDKMLYSLHWLGFWARVVRHRWALIVDLRDAPLTYLLWRRRRAGMTRNSVDEHRVVRLARVLDLDAPPAPRMYLGDEDKARAKALITDDGPVLAIGPTANWRAKTWRSDHFSELVGRLTGADGVLPNARIAIFGRGDERPSVVRLIESIPAERRIDLIGRVDLLTAYACLARCDLYVGNDSGLMHLAAASGIPTLGLFGPSKDTLYAPWGPYAHFVRTPESFDEIFPAGFDHRRSDTLMDSLTVDMAEAGVRSLWAQRQRAA
jgi:heptosyltransferase-3